MSKSPAPISALAFRNVTATSADLYLYEPIGFGVSASEFIKQLVGLKVSTINVHINSPGGSVFDGFAIYNALHAHPASIVVHIDGIAASIASVIAMAGDKILMAENAMMMVHCPSCGADGGADYLRTQADVLDQLETNIANVYAARSGMSPGDAVAMMESETWLTAAECLAKGLCTEVVQGKKMAAHFDAAQFIAGFKTAPAALPLVEEDNKTPPLSILLLRQALLEKTTDS